MTSGNQLVISSIEEDILASRLKNVQFRLAELLEELEARNLNREDMSDRIKLVEKEIKLVRQRL